MKALIFAVSALLFTSSVALSARAGDMPRPSAAGATSATPRQASWMETDPKTGTIRFLVNGVEQVQIDATGLHVKNNLSYAGTLTDGETLTDLSTATRKGKP